MGGYIVSPSTMNSMLTTTRKVNLTTASSSSVSVSVWILGTLEADTGKQFNINHHNTLFFACVPSFFKAASCLSALSETLKSRRLPLTADTVDCLGKAGRVCNCSRNDCGRTTGECLTALACTASRLMAIFFMTVPPLTFCIAPLFLIASPIIPRNRTGTRKRMQQRGPQQQFEQYICKYPCYEVFILRYFYLSKSCKILNAF